MVATIPTSEAERLTHDRVIEILDTKYATELDGELGRSGTPITTDEGLFLPDPGRYIRQESPTRQQMREADDVVVYEGQTGEADYGDWRNHGSGHLVKAHVPWAATIVVGQAPQDPASDPVQSRNYTTEEILNLRISDYVAVLRHTLSKWSTIGSGSATRANAIQSIEEGSSVSTLVEIQTGAASNPLRGVGSFQFTIQQWQVFPNHDQT